MLISSYTTLHNSTALNRTDKCSAAFIYSKKGFDSIPMDTIFEKLKMYGITATFFNTSTNMYPNIAYKIKIWDRLLDTLYPNQGVCKEFMLNPLLFNIVLADIPKLLRQIGACKLRSHTEKLSCIIWADNLKCCQYLHSTHNKFIRNKYCKIKM